jgi:hypothetical protein
MMAVELRVAPLPCPPANAGLDGYGAPLRQCADCPSRLRKSNKGTRCGPCERRATEMALAEKDRAAEVPRARKVAGIDVARRRFFRNSGKKVSAVARVEKARPCEVVNDLDPLPPAKLCKRGCGQPRHGGRCKGPGRFACGPFAAAEYKPGPRQAIARIPEWFRYPDPSDLADITCVVALAEVPGPSRGGRPRNAIAVSRIERLWGQVLQLASGQALLVTCESSQEARDMARRMRTRAKLAGAQGEGFMARRMGMDCWFWRVRA